MDRPVDHVLRPQLPWRDEPGLTECGLDSKSGISVVTREEFIRRMKEMGERRAQIATCMTCLDTSRRWGSWEDDPRQQMQREISWEMGWKAKRGQRLRDELEAVASLVAAHREEFEELIRVSGRRKEWLEMKIQKGKPS